MILTYNLKHGRDFSSELKKAKKIASFAIKTKSSTSKDVRHLGLKSAITNQVLRKYRRKEIKKATHVRLSIPGQSVKHDDAQARQDGNPHPQKIPRHSGKTAKTGKIPAPAPDKTPGKKHHQVTKPQDIKKLVDIAVSEKCGIRFEKLTNIRQNKMHHKHFRYSLNSWSYHQLQKFVQYRARSRGIEVAYVAPAYTSQSCSRCRSPGNRKQKRFQCVKCGHADHADVNAAFNIGNPVSHCAFGTYHGSVARTKRFVQWEHRYPAKQQRRDAGDCRTPNPLGLGVCQKINTVGIDQNTHD